MTTEVSFHFNAPDKLGYACRLLRKAYLKGARLVVLVDSRALPALDAALWDKTTFDFLPHATQNDPPHVLAHSPIILCSDRPDTHDRNRVLVNLRPEMPEDYAAFDKVIEVVTGEPHDRDPARERWRQYRQAGIEPLRYDLQLAPQA